MSLLIFTFRTGETGLGLNIVKNIMLLHHAKYGAINTENGVMFFIEFLNPGSGEAAHE